MSFFVISSSLRPSTWRKPSRTAQRSVDKGSSVQSHVAVIDIDGPDLDAMLARIAHQLRRLVEAHGLAVEDGGAEHIRDRWHLIQAEA